MIRGMDPWDKKTGIPKTLKKIEGKVRSEKWRNLIRNWINKRGK